MTKTFGLLIET